MRRAAALGLAVLRQLRTPERFKGGGGSAVTEPDRLRCPRCDSAVQSDQEYCLECGVALGTHPGLVDRVSTRFARRHAWAGTWIVPALLALVVAALGTGAAIAISGSAAAPTAVSVATGGNLTVPETASTLTAPEPTGPSRTTKGPPAAAPTATPARIPAAVTWPRGRRGWTIVLLSMPQANGRAAAGDEAAEARQGGLRRVGVLDSSRYASLHPGYYVIFHGIFDSEVEAASALQRARAVVPGAYPREIIP
jgi:hypothetical protein